MRTPGRRLMFLAATIALAIPITAGAQSATPVAGEPSTSTWRLASGFGWLSLRDVARSGRPVDASPVAWFGDGNTIELDHIWGAARHVHRADVVVSLLRNFEYRSPLTSIERPASDAYRAVDGRWCSGVVPQGVTPAGSRYVAGDG